MAIALTPKQQRAFKTNRERVIVSAGAGSGKTRVLVERFVRLVREKEAKLEEILMVTFTDKAAKEMRERILKRFEEEGMYLEIERFNAATIDTIHSFCARILLENQMLVSVPANYTLLDEAGQRELLERVLSQRLETAAVQNEKETLDLFRSYGFQSLLTGVDHAFKKCRSLGLIPAQLKENWNREKAVQECKKQLLIAGLEIELSGDLSWEECETWKNLKFGREKEKKLARDKALSLIFEIKGEKVKKDLKKLFGELWDEVESEKNAAGLIDYDDFQILARDLFMSHPEIRRKYQRKYKYIMVDEYQDTNPLQVELLNLLRSEKNDFVVGDKKQAIYGFRHADVAAFNEMENALGNGDGGECLALDENFRSRGEVIHFVNAFFEKIWAGDSMVNYRPLIAAEKNRAQSGSVEIALFDKEGLSLSQNDCRRQEARWIAERIHKLVREEGYTFADIVLLTRSTTSLHLYEKIFFDHGIPVFLVSGRGFYAQQEIFDLINLLKVLNNPALDISLAGFLRSPFAGIEDDTLYWMARTAKKESRETPLWEAAVRVESIPEISTDEKEKVTVVLEQLNFLKQNLRYWDLPRLIEEGLKVFQYGAKTLCFSEGRQRLANLQKCIRLSREFQHRRAAAGLDEFVAFLDFLEKEKTKEEEAPLEEEVGNVVRVMTMHKSKGLEFPVVFALDCGRSDPNQREDFRFAGDGSFAAKIWNPLSNEKEKPFWFQQLHEQEKQKEWDEKKRLFYVVCTRAEQKLILVGSTAFPAKDEKKEKEMASPVPSKPWADWLRYSFQLGGNETALPEGTRFIPIDYKEERDTAAIEHKGGKLISAPADHSELAFIKKEDLSRFEESGAGTVSVTQMMHFRECPYRFYLLYRLGWQNWEGVEEKEEPDDGIAAAIPAQSVGTLVHRVLELASLESLEKEAPALIRRIEPSAPQMLEEEVMEMVRVFNQTSLYKELLQAQSVYKEWPFTVAYEGFLLDGTLDLLYEGPDKKWNVVDYKTSQFSSSTLREKTEAYRFQLELYLWALDAHFSFAPKPKGGLMFLRKGHLEPVDCPDQNEFNKKLKQILHSIKAEEFSPTPSRTVCARCSARTICTSKM